MQENVTAIVAPSTEDRQHLTPPMRKPAVLQVLPALVTGGVERGTIEVAHALAEVGWTSVVASSGGPMVRELTRVGVEHIELPLESKKPWVMRRNIRLLEDIIVDRKIDIVHARSRAPAWSAWAAANNTGARFITTFHGTYNLGGFGFKQIYNSVMTRGEKVIAISDFIAEHVCRIYGVPPEKIRVIHRGVDLKKFNPVRVSPERIIQLAHKWRLPDGYQVIMLPGRLTRWKGQEVLIRALAELGRHDIRCLLVGSEQGRTAYLNELKELARKLEVADVVHMVGECSDMAAAYMLADVVVSPSTDPEAFGRVVVEAQAMGRPVISSAHGAPCETILPGRTGWLATPGDPSALAEALHRFFSMSAEERGDMAALAQEFVRVNFSKESMCNRTLDVYREVLAEPPPPLVEAV